MSPELLAALKASFADPVRDWAAIGVSPSTDGDGHGTITYQLRSAPLGLLIVATREISGAADFVRLFVNGFAYTTDDEELIDQIAALATPAVVEAEADLLALLEDGGGYVLTATGVTAQPVTGTPGNCRGDRT